MGNAMDDETTKALEAIIAEHFDDAIDAHAYTSAVSMRAAVVKAYQLGRAPVAEQVALGPERHSMCPDEDGRCQHGDDENCEKISLPAVRQVDKKIVLQASEYVGLVYNSRRYEWLRDNMRKMPLGEAGTRHFFDQPGTMSFQEAVDVERTGPHSKP